MFHKITSVSQKLPPGLRKIIGNVAWLFSERILTMLISLSVGIYLIRYLGAENFGKLSYSISFVALFSAITKLGLDNIVVRDIVQCQKETYEILGTAFLLKLCSSLIALLSISITLLALNVEEDVRQITSIIALTILFSPFEVIDFWFQSQVLAGAVTIVRSGQLILSSIIKMILVNAKFPFLAFVWLNVIDALVRPIGTTVVYFKHDRSIFQWRLNWSIAIRMLKNSWPLMLSTIMISIFMKIDQIMLGNMTTDREVGNYAAAVKLSEIWYFIPSAVCSSVFPAIVRSKARSYEDYYDRLQKFYDLMAWLSFAITIPLSFFGKSLITHLLGQEYKTAGDILFWHIWSTPFVFLWIARGQWLIAENLTKYSFATTCVGAISNVILNLWLIPLYGGTGAALATLISYMLVSHGSCILYPPMFKTGWMLTKALFIPFRITQNLYYLSLLRKMLS
jgi:O-antigen/teichoic acid export membrane protein